MLKRVTLIRNYGEFQAGTDGEFADADGHDLADSLIKRGIAKVARVQRIYGHMDEMSKKQQDRALEELEVAERAGGYRDQGARARALDPYRAKAVAG